MATQITGALGSPAPDGTLIPLAGASIYISPSQSTQLRIQYGGSGDFSLVTANTSLPVPYQYGFVTQTDNAGTYDFLLPKDTEIHTTDPDAFKWNISLPDGSVYSGPALAAAGPYSLDDLITGQGWELSSSLVVNATILGQVAQGTIAVNGQDSVEVEFTGPAMPDQHYQVFPSPTRDSGTDQIPGVEAISRTANGFTLKFTFTYTGSVDYIAWHP